MNRLNQWNFCKFLFSRFISNSYLHKFFWFIEIKTFWSSIVNFLQKMKCYQSKYFDHVNLKMSSYHRMNKINWNLKDFIDEFNRNWSAIALNDIFTDKNWTNVCFQFFFLSRMLSFLIFHILTISGTTKKKQKMDCEKKLGK